MRSRFVKQLLQGVAEQTGRHATRRNVLAWDLDRRPLEKIQDDQEEVVFLPGLDIWCLIKTLGDKA